MIDRLTHIIEKFNLTASQFADEIGVQRSSVSHVLSGRNKPSLDFITKIILRYQELDAEWLLTGKGKMLRSENLAGESNISEDIKEGEGTGNVPLQPHNPLNELPLTGFSPKKKEAGRAGTRSGSAIDKIVFFYSDGSFEEYLPKG